MATGRNAQHNSPTPLRSVIGTTHPGLAAETCQHIDLTTSSAGQSLPRASRSWTAARRCHP